MKEKSKHKKDRFDINETGVYIYGQRIAVIDGYAEIYDYSEKEVVFYISGQKKYLILYGRSLTVRCAGRSISEVSGHIDGVRYETEIKNA